MNQTSTTPSAVQDILHNHHQISIRACSPVYMYQISMITHVLELVSWASPSYMLARETMLEQCEGTCLLHLSMGIKNIL